MLICIYNLYINSSFNYIIINFFINFHLRLGCPYCLFKTIDPLFQGPKSQSQRSCKLGSNKKDVHYSILSISLFTLYLFTFLFSSFF